MLPAFFFFNLLLLLLNELDEAFERFGLEYPNYNIQMHTNFSSTLGLGSERTSGLQPGEQLLAHMGSNIRQCQ